jgi:hypothetical protein
MALAHEQQPLVSEVSTKFCGQRGVAWWIPMAVFSVFWTGDATFLSHSYSIILTRLSGPHSRPTTSQKIW